MSLSEAVVKALDAFRAKENPLQGDNYWLALYAIKNAMLALCPVRTIGGIVIRWDDEITPERLVACGFDVDRRACWFCGCVKIVPQNGDRDWHIHGNWVPSELAPRNMGEVWSLMERCGIEVPNA